MSYTPPSGDAVNFSFEGGYSAPNGDQVHFLFGTVAVITINSVSRSTIGNTAGFDKTIIDWQSSAAGEYSIEMGGSGVTTGDVMASGTIGANTAIETEITDDDITGAAGYSGEQEYRFNIYVQSSDGIWTPYGYSG
jgi:hypothetical protein